jgi:hypothetical protein
MPKPIRNIALVIAALAVLFVAHRISLPERDPALIVLTGSSAATCESMAARAGTRAPDFVLHGAYRFETGPGAGICVLRVWLRGGPPYVNSTTRFARFLIDEVGVPRQDVSRSVVLPPR